MITRVLELRIVGKMGSMLEESSWMVRKDNKATARRGRLQIRLETELRRLKATSEFIGYK